ncbi:1-acyl-sn-glycerol-3-phosphate acyltransferase, putative (LPAAT) [Plasmodium ovale wallikeri]|uniref:1-acyl-sn-glycerol-3-phosphate acyltransferase, putative n=2 Tax=Plasmodium ovale TaxID=36330 RepID=A0A1C3KWC1_PLAOA|nr:1-acyl-sn-glycerol-3-phosphate acyltransferase, putative (LPAAT) [Plasmodium ovale wallikeri]SBT78491.1 1-acyl-sn-glycerol-3-phosphate acyltransferase, putative [Plasmodium ovale]
MENSKKSTYKPSNIIIRLFVSAYISVLLIFLMTFAVVSQFICFILFFPIILYSREAKITIFGYCFRIAMYTICSPLNPFWRVKLIRKPKKGYYPYRTLLMSNHLSSLDPWLISAYTLKWNIKFIFKASLFKVPIGGLALYFAGDIPIYFTKGKGGWEVKSGGVDSVMKQCREYQDLNICLTIFPEGTRSLNGQLQLFKSGFFRFAIENNSEILPFVVHGTSKLWPVRGKLLDMGTAYISFGDPIQPTPGMTVDQLKEKTRNAMLELIKEFPDYDPEVDTLATEMSNIRGHGF